MAQVNPEPDSYCSKNSNSGIILSVETAIRGGSISIFRKGKLIGSWEGSEQISKSEDILVQLNNLLVEYKIEKKMIDLLICSHGPGSSTGIRIGLAIAKGLSKSINCHYITASPLEALVCCSGHSQNVLAAAPFGTNQVVWKIFQNYSPFNKTKSNKTNNFFTSKEKSFFSDIKNLSFDKAVLYEFLYKRWIEIKPRGAYNTKQIFNAGNNPSILLAEKYLISNTNKNIGESALRPIMNL